MAVFKVGDRVSYHGNVGTVCDFENPNPPPANPFEIAYQDALANKKVLLILFDGDHYKNKRYHPYFIIFSGSLTLVKSVVRQPLSCKSCCPLCGSSGDDLVFKFYCSNKQCNNFVK